MKWLSIKQIKQIYNVNWYVRYWFYKKHNSEHLIAFKKEGKYLFIDYDYFRAIEAQEERNNELAIHVFYELIDRGYKVYTIANIMAKKSDKKIEYYHRFILDVLFNNKKRVATIKVSKKYDEFIRLGKEMLNENQ